MSQPTALVTGASSGIGYVFAEKLAEAGYKVTSVARREKQLNELTAKLGEGHDYIVADLTKPEDLDKVSQHVKEKKYSLLINNAGYGLYGRFTDIPLEKFEHMISLNINALVRLSYDYLQGAQKGDTLMNVSSTLSRLPYPGGAVYSATKGFVTNFTEALWYEYKDKGIFVTALMPGMTNTEFHHVALGEREKELNRQMSYPPEVVVDEAMTLLKFRHKPSLASGPRYRRIIFLLTKMMGRKKMLKLMGERNIALKKSK